VLGAKWQSNGGILQRAFLGRPIRCAQIEAAATGHPFAQTAERAGQGGTQGMEFDYVIVGAGSSGAVVANRLSADPTVSVALIEAGGDGHSAFIDTPGAFGVHALLTTYNWAYESEPCPGTANRRHFCPRGKAVGGSSAINGMVYIRGDASDYDHWAQLGNRGWSYADVLPYFRRAEANSRGTDAYHGADGPLTVGDIPNDYRAADRFIEAARQAGHPENADFNGARLEGVGPYQFTIRDGRRCGTRAAYIDPIATRPNLTILSRSHALKLNLVERRAVSVEILRAGQPITVRARNEIILSCGAFATPQLLMLSGIGPGEELAAHGIETLHALPGVGQNLLEHPDVQVAYRSPRRDGFSLAPRGLLHLVSDTVRYALGHKGRLAQSLTQAGGFLKSADHVEVPDLQLHFVPVLYDNYGRSLKPLFTHGLSLHACLLRPQSVGSIGLSSADPMAAPRIQLNMLERPEDTQALVQGIRLMRTIMAQPALADFVSAELMPGADIGTDADLEDYVRRTCQHAYHPVGTAKMGRDAMAVVDDTLKVHGLAGLRIADASVMPYTVSGNTNAACIMIGEKCADLVRGAAPLPRAEFTPEAVPLPAAS
jgi:choline dehydrogenase